MRRGKGGLRTCREGRKPGATAARQHGTVPKPQPLALGWQRRAHAPCQVCPLEHGGSRMGSHQAPSLPEPPAGSLAVLSFLQEAGGKARLGAAEVQQRAGFSCQHLSPCRCQQVPEDAGSPVPVTAAQAGSQLCLPQGAGAEPGWFAAMRAKWEHPGWAEHPALASGTQAGVATRAGASTPAAVSTHAELALNTQTGVSTQTGGK